MKALPGPGPSPTSTGCGYRGAGDGFHPQPGLWAIPVGAVAVAVAGAWAADTVSRWLCASGGCTPTSYLPAVLWALAGIFAVVVAVPVLLVAGRRGWLYAVWRAVRVAGLFLAALAIVAVRRVRARRAVRVGEHLAARTVVHVEAVDQPRELAADRGDVVDVEVLVGGTWERA